MQLRNILSLADFELAARKHLPRPILGYVAGGAEDNIALQSAAAAYRQWSFVPRVLVDVSQRSQQVELLGETYASPFGIAPMGISALIAYEGDLALARAAEAANIPMIVSSTALTRLEEVRAAAPRSTWFQAYLPGDAAKIDAMVQRVRSAGYRTLVLTVDVATLPSRENNVRVGFTMPLRPSVRLAWDGITRPRWTIGTLLRTLLRHGMPHFENSSAARGVPIFSRAAVREFGSRDTLSWTHVDQMRRLWPGSLVLKGILSTEDARIAADRGVDGVIVSNHGGRQLDSSTAPLHALPSIVRVKGSMKVMIDSGIRRGTDVLKAMALGADFVFLGRPFIYAAAIGGQAGVAHAIRLLSHEIQQDMALLGVNSLRELGPAALSRSAVPGTTPSISRAQFPAAT
ncbi:MAG: alpha-hydroxy-acid oxidizing protein [Burkholderiaceae bacterium]|nr:alpha-hydroxy-acid oxidizing protein [Burkholderiaceae bacterium]